MDILDRIKGKLDDLTTLDIVTAVGRPSIGPDGRLKVDSAHQAVMVTQIQLLESDITTTMDEEFVTGEYKDLRAFHQQRVSEGLQSVRDKIAALKELYQLASALGRATPDSPRQS